MDFLYTDTDSLVVHADNFKQSGIKMGAELGDMDDDLKGGTYTYVEITDNGCGMNAEILSRVFDPFFSTKFVGRGLGLAAILGIIRGHKGAVEVSSEPDKGTMFKVFLSPMLAAK